MAWLGVHSMHVILRSQQILSKDAALTFMGTAALTFMGTVRGAFCLGFQALDKVGQVSIQ